MATKKQQGPLKSPPLRRGKACLNCRHLKIRCDGVRPVCGQCTRLPKEDQCEYTDTTSRTQELENTVYRLQSRLNELQQGPAPQIMRNILIARRPIVLPEAHLSANLHPVTFPQLSPHSCLERNPPPRRKVPFAGRKWNIRDRLGRNLRRQCLQCFLPHATQFGFFLHTQRFQDAVLLPFPFGDERRPSPALLYVVYLWGAHLSQSQALRSSERVFLRRAQEHISTEISAHTHSTHLLHTIQAQVLLSTYLVRLKRLLEAEFYVNGAATLALGYQLHKIRSARPVTPPLLGVPVLVEVYPAPPADAIEEGERIRAFWAVACLQSNLNTSVDAGSPSFCILESPGTGINTPWPLEIEDYEMGALPPGYQGEDTIRHFLTEESFSPSPLCALHAKASVLFYRATRLGTGWSPNLQPQELAAYRTSYVWLDQRITAFWQALPPVYAFYGNSAAARTLALTHALTAAAAIRLHSSPAATDAEAQAKCLFAARAILDVLGDARVGDQAMVHPVVGALCTLSCRILMEEVRRVQAFRTAWAVGGPEKAALLTELHLGMTTMAVYAAECPLVEYQLHKLRQHFETI
ncbi:hypothetical protein B0H13DRAFT_2270494 [Mycena leptocephala]|nr:hypothetical protein B0H13DRAFT_2270494 [Mycena leptocephala]